MGFERAEPAATGRPAYHPATLLKIYVYGYLNRVQSSRRLEREAQRNLELIWLTGRLAPDFKTIADFRQDNGAAIRKVCREFVLLCRRLNLFTDAIVAIDGSKFKAVNNRDKNFTERKLQARMRATRGEHRSATWPSSIVPTATRAAVTEAGSSTSRRRSPTSRSRCGPLRQIGTADAGEPRTGRSR